MSQILEAQTSKTHQSSVASSDTSSKLTPSIFQFKRPYSMEREVACEECGGSGFDPGGVDPWGPEPCPVCRGAKTLRIVRNFLAEAFQIAANPDSTRPVERQHLIAIIHHCRELVSALVALPDVARESPAEPRGSAKPITHFRRRKHEITFRPQRARSRKRAPAGG